MTATDIDVSALFDAQRARQPAVRALGAEQRIARIRRLREALLAWREAFYDALAADFGKPPTEVDFADLAPVVAEAKHAEANLRAWMRPQRVSTPLPLVGTRSEVYVEPKGVALILAPWNYPVNLTLGPLVSALAAGCTAVVKPSEHTPHTSALLRTFVGELFDPAEVAVVEGAAEVAQALLALPFDHVYFTGSPAVGRHVMQAAAVHLTSVTLELGGKSPAYVDASADVAQAAAALAWGKFSNAGQTCIAPDYVLAHTSVHDALVTALADQVAAMYGSSEAARRASPDYARIVNAHHHRRLAGLLDDAVARGAAVAVGGRHDAATRYLAPTVLTGVPADAAVMQDEIFGPLLPILRAETLAEAVAFVNARPKPLVAYVFAEDERVAEHVLARTSAGATCVNETLLHYFNPDLPFGGIGTSGMGRGHGHAGFLAFSNQRAVLRRRFGNKLVQRLYPPYAALARRAADAVLRWG